MIGIGIQTGRKIEGTEHLAQSIHDILTTPKGTLVMQRAYGSDLPKLIDEPINGENLIDLYQATAEALDLWEPRIDLARIQVIDASPGRVDFELVDENGNVLPMPVSKVA